LIPPFPFAQKIEKSVLMMMMRRTKKYKKRQIVEGYLFMIPWLIGFFGFTIYPLIASVYYSFTS